jgi:hypothetical protein
MPGTLEDFFRSRNRTPPSLSALWIHRSNSAVLVTDKTGLSACATTSQMLPTDPPSYFSLSKSVEQCRTRRSQGLASTNPSSVIRLSAFQLPGDRSAYAPSSRMRIGRSGLEMDPHVDLTACTQGQASQSVWLPPSVFLVQAQAEGMTGWIEQDAHVVARLELGEPGAQRDSVRYRSLKVVYLYVEIHHRALLS